MLFVHGPRLAKLAKVGLLRLFLKVFFKPKTKKSPKFRFSRF